MSEPRTRSRRAAPPAEEQDGEQQVDLVATAKTVFAGDLPKGIHAKLSMILATMPEDMRPEGTNKHFHYQYWELDQISGYFRNRFGDLGLSFLADVVSFDVREHKTSKEGISFLTTLLVNFRIHDWETGEWVEGHGIGQGDDPGDKGANKAFSGALKYWLLKTFIVGGEDTEADEDTDRRSEPRGRRRGGDNEEQRVEIGSSNITGIARGGRSSHTTDAQIRQIRHLAKDLNWTAKGTATRIAEWLNEEWELPEAAEEQGEALLRYLDRLDADDAGMVITKMVDLKDAPDEDENDDDDARYRDAHLSDYP